MVPALDPRTPYSSRFTDYVDCLNPAVWKGKMYPTEWAGNKIEILARNHPLVWVEDPYALLEPAEIERLKSALNFISHSVLCVQNAFDLRKELLCREPGKPRLVVIDQSYTLRDPHLLPKDAKPSEKLRSPASTSPNTFAAASSPRSRSSPWRICSRASESSIQSSPSAT